MPATINDFYHGPARGTPDAAIANAKTRGARNGFDRFIREIFRIAPQLKHPRYRYGLDPTIAVAESSDETGVWTSDYWDEWNPAGIGIWKDGVPSPFVRPIKDPEESARLFLYHVWIHLHGDSVPVPEILLDVVGLDTHAPKVIALTKDPKRPLVQRIKDLCLPYEDSTGEAQCTWACNPNYANQIVDHAHFLFGSSIPTQTGDIMATLGRVPQPPINRRLITNKIVGVGRDPDAQRDVKFTVVHSMVGTLPGTDAYFRNPGVAALTDFGIGLTLDSNGDGFADIYQWNDPWGRVIGWASGPAQAPWGDGARAIANWGVGGVNRYGASIELDDAGNIGTPVSAAQWSSLCWMLAWLHDKMGQTADTFGWNIHHREFTGTAYKDCPFPRVYNFTAQYQAVVKAIMRYYQEGVDYPPEGFSINGRTLTLPTAGRVVTGEEQPTTPSTGGKTVYPEGMDEDLARAWFGRGKGKIDGKNRSYGFDPNGTVSKTWLAYVKSTGHAPALETVEQYGDRMYWRFSNGLVMWRKNKKSKVQILGG